jgi:hypothetical protein
MVVPLLAGALGISGCSAGKPPVENLSKAELAIQQASKSTASQYAPLELQTAQDQYEGARRAIGDEKYDEARRLADQALANAQLAEAKAGAEKSRQAAAELHHSIEVLRAEIERMSAAR